ncbi:unnamed protein product [Heligmosomoides polygyrus]|uniref:Prospero domain-containing protein n=1 Tax=Heligmosomoides polygyrus TaxID=6339 RepID=A0A183FWU3_HELPZ|nr:unnamed protein product [Heligmosomoides polygyrus]
MLGSREFYYIQMDKFARQALAEGITSRDDIVVTMDSEIFRTLNQHYNRNNHVQPPENLVNVVQESLREFFDAIRLGKDAEPSWKKQIYKVSASLADEPSFFGRHRAAMGDFSNRGSDKRYRATPRDNRRHLDSITRFQVINRLDDQIPEYFKDPNFLERLE